MAAVPSLGVFGRWAVYHAAGSFLSAYGLLNFLRGDSIADAVNIHGRRVVLEFDRSVLGAGGDPAITGFSVINITDDALDTTWTTDDYTAVKNAILTWWGAIKGYHKFVTLTAIKFYDEGVGVHAPNPAVATFAVNVPATGAGAMPGPQTAHTITLRTPVRRSWGRLYMPTPDGAQIVNGRFNSATFAAYLGAFRTMMNTLAAAGFVMCVWSPTHSAYIGIQAIECDDALDVIRSRRLDTQAKLILDVAA